MEEEPVKEGYTRVYTDHTGRYYTDYSPEDMQAMIDDPLAKILREEITKEINKEIIDAFAKRG